ncbi:Isochorismatase hydrolase [Fistulina hepatica ATCC 64428]|uniref:Isochorismatase hydrolase n=1 Tax=Fistulina hepatica ATCC 64428 TaxID=1128425 RepID=A0A0D7AKE5_9AGAR|nr:Isochorismatase hydrolase [Fistulina hepatica ATCC 64428]
MPLSRAEDAQKSSGAVVPQQQSHSSCVLTGRVLLVLEAQEGVLAPPPRGVPASARVRQNITHVIACARHAQPPPQIVFVRNAGEPGDDDARDASGWSLAITPHAGEVVVDKRKNNAFLGSNLEAHIPCDAEVIVVGMLSDHCVRATCRALLERGNEVLLVHGAHAAYDRLEVPGVTCAEKIEREIEQELEKSGVLVLGLEDAPLIFMDR